MTRIADYFKYQNQPIMLGLAGGFALLALLMLSPAFFLNLLPVLVLLARIALLLALIGLIGSAGAYIAQEIETISAWRLDEVHP